MIGGDSAIVRAMAAIEAKRDGADVKHICPECGGEFAEHLGAFAIVATCWACKGVGVLTADQLDSYLQRSREKGSGIDVSRPYNS